MVVQTAVAPPASVEGREPPAHSNSFLSGTDQQKHDHILQHFALEAYALDDIPLSEAEKFWLSQECIQRYIRASKGIEMTTITRLEATLRWRRGYGFGTSAMSAESEDLRAEGETGKMILYGFDTANRPCLYSLPSRQNTDGVEGQIKFYVFMLERAFDLCGPGVESLALLINFADRAKKPSFTVGRAALSILQEHYPERLGAAYVVQIPFIVDLFLRVIMPFVDPRTREKLHFNPRMVEDGFIDRGQLPTFAGWGGDVEFDWNHAVYWPALLKLCSERHEKELVVWRELGSKLGSSEWDVKCQAHGEHARGQSDADEVAPTALPSMESSTA